MYFLIIIRYIEYMDKKLSLTSDTGTVGRPAAEVMIRQTNVEKF